MMLHKPYQPPHESLRLIKCVLAASSLMWCCSVEGAHLTNGGQVLAVSWGGDVYNIDIPTGQAEELSRPDEFFNSMAKSNSGVFLASFSIGRENRLFNVNPSDGSVELFSVVQGVVYGETIRGMTFTRDNRLIAVMNGAFDGPLDNQLYEIDTLTGNATLIGHTGMEGLQSLATAPDGTVYSFDLEGAGLGLVTVDPITGMAADINPLDNDGGTAIQSLAFDAHGTLYAMGQGATYIANVADGTLEKVTDFSIDIRGMEFVVPEPQSLQQSLLACLVAGVLLSFRSLKTSTSA